MIYGIPGINGLGKTKGTERTPEYFLMKSHTLKIKKKNILKIDRDDISKQEKIIYNFALDIFKKRNHTIFIGGDHSISYPLARAFFEKNKNPKILIFDAHPDLMPAEFEPTHEEWLRALIKKSKIMGERILLVGIRRNSENIDMREISYAKKNGIEIIYADEFQKKKYKIFDFIRESDLYLSFDVDVFDKSIFLATGYPEKNGLKENEILETLKKIVNYKKVFAFDLVEYNPRLDINKKNLKTIEKVLKIIKPTQNYED